MRLRSCIALMMGITLVACAGLPAPPFDTDAHIDLYVTGLDLSEHSMADAATILVREGFRCKAQDETFYCGHFLQGSRSLTITLTPNATDHDRCVVQHDFSITVI